MGAYFLGFGVSFWQALIALAHRLHVQPAGPRHSGQTSSAQRTHLGAGHQPTLPLVQVRNTLANFTAHASSVTATR